MRRIFVFVGTCSVLVLAAFMMWLPRRPIPFQSTDWKNHPEVANANDVRNRMADDLINRALTPAQSREEVERVLGCPDESFKAGQDFYGVHAKYDTTCYWLYKVQGDYLEFLAIEYDRSDHLIRARKSGYAN